MINHNIKNKAFTLVELLAVIVLLSILMMIIVKNISAIVEKSKARDYELLCLNLENASRNYVNDHRFILEGMSKSNPEVIIYVNDLVNEGYLKLPLIDARVDKEISLQSLILIALVDGEITYSFEFVYE